MEPSVFCGFLHKDGSHHHQLPVGSGSTSMAVRGHSCEVSSWVLPRGTRSGWASDGCPAHICTPRNSFSLIFGEVRGPAQLLVNNGVAIKCHLSARGRRVSQRRREREAICADSIIKNSDICLSKLLGQIGKWLQVMWQMETCSEKCIASWFCHPANRKSTYRNLDGVVTYSIGLLDVIRRHSKHKRPEVAAGVA